MATLIWRSGSSTGRPVVGFKSISWHIGLKAYAWSPPTDVYETEASFIIRCEIAGMRESDLSINIDKNHLILSGVRTETCERRAYHQMEIRFGEFSTAVELPSGVDINGVEAEYEDGFLTIVLPKNKPSEIPIKT